MSEDQEATAAGSRKANVIGWLVFVVVIAFLLRSYGLNTKSLWLDETISLARISGSFDQMIDDVALNDGHPPVYYGTLYILTWPFRGGGMSDRTLRYPSVLASLLTLAVVYLIERRLNPERKFPAASAMFALSAFAVFYAQDARNYALSGLWVALSTFFLLRSLDEEIPSTRDFIGFFISTALALYTFYYTLFFLVSQAAAVLILKKVQKKTWMRWACFFGAPFVVFLLYVPVILGMREKLRAAGAPMGFQMPGLADLLRLASEIGVGYHPLLRDKPIVYCIIVFVLVTVPVVIFCLGRGSWRPGHCLLLCLLAGPVLCLLFFPFKPHLFESKHLYPMTPFLFLLMAEVVQCRQGAANDPSTRFGAKIAATAVALILALNIHSLILYHQSDFQKEDWKGAVRFVTKGALLGDLILPAPFYLESPIKRYCPREQQPLIRSIRPGIKDSSKLSLTSYENIWLIELLDSPVSYEDKLSRGIAQRNRKAEQARIFPGILGTVRVTKLQKKP